MDYFVRIISYYMLMFSAPSLVYTAQRNSFLLFQRTCAECGIVPVCPGLSISLVFGSLICFNLIPSEIEKIIRFSFDSVSHVLLCHTGDGLSAVAVRVFFIWILLWFGCGALCVARLRPGSLYL